MYVTSLSISHPSSFHLGRHSLPPTYTPALFNLIQLLGLQQPKLFCLLLRMISLPHLSSDTLCWAATHIPIPIEKLNSIYLSSDTVSRSPSMQTPALSCLDSAAHLRSLKLPFLRCNADRHLLCLALPSDVRTQLFKKGRRRERTVQFFSYLFMFFPPIN